MAFLNFYFSFRLGTSSALFLLLLFVFSGFLEGSKKSTGLEIKRSQPLIPSLRPQGVAMARACPMASHACECACPQPWARVCLGGRRSFQEA